MNEELLHAITDLAYARFYYFRNSSRNHNINITQFLANESWFLMLLSRFPVERHTPQPRRRQYEIRTQRIDLTNAANLFDNLFPENINLEEFLQTPVTVRLTIDQLRNATHPWNPPADSTEICCLCQENLLHSLCIETSCNHHLHEECSRDLFLNFSVKCPVCRADLREARPTNINGGTSSSGVHSNVQS